MKSGQSGLAASEHIPTKTGRLPIGLRARTLSGLVLAPIGLALAFIGGIAFALLLAVCSILVFREWDRLIIPPAFAPLVADPSARLALFSIGVVSIATALAWDLPWMLLPTIALIPLAIGRKGWGWVVAGLCYAILPSAGLIVLRGDAEHGAIAVVFVLVVVWITDISAFATGSLIGGVRLSPRISPAKTWSGAVGGVVSTGIATLIAKSVGLLPGDTVPMLALALALAISAQLGDLFESWLKRRFGVKDSGRLIPGHGGAMDRLDSLILAAMLASLIGIARGGNDAAATGLLVW